ncbi:MAG: hypothetical protein F9K32_14530 [Desulfobulbaceae bacterium]|nr:MAG: hypothetical protein F9K32_14530 [Desulfobulbaceae bacterium]
MRTTIRYSLSLAISVFFFAVGFCMNPLHGEAADNKSPQPVATGEQKTASEPQKPYEFKNDEEKVNYAIGVQLIGNFQRQGHKVNLDMMTMGMRDALAGGELALPDGELRRLIMLYQNAVKRGYIQQKKDSAEKKQ